MVSTNWLKDPTDHQWDNDPGMQEWHGFMAKNMPGADLTDLNYVYSYTASNIMLHVLKQCNGNFSRDNIMKQAQSLHNLHVADALPGITVSTGPTDHRPIKAMQLSGGTVRPGCCSGTLSRRQVPDRLRCGRRIRRPLV